MQKEGPDTRFPVELFGQIVQFLSAARDFIPILLVSTDVYRYFHADGADDCMNVLFYCRDAVPLFEKATVLERLPYLRNVECRLPYIPPESRPKPGNPYAEPVPICVTVLSHLPFVRSITFSNSSGCTMELDLATFPHPELLTKLKIDSGGYGLVVGHLDEETIPNVSNLIIRASRKERSRHNVCVLPAVLPKLAYCFLDVSNHDLRGESLEKSAETLRSLTFSKPVPPEVFGMGGARRLTSVDENTIGLFEVLSGMRVLQTLFLTHVPMSDELFEKIPESVRDLTVGNQGEWKRVWSETVSRKCQSLTTFFVNELHWTANSGLEILPLGIVDLRMSGVTVSGKIVGFARHAPFLRTLCLFNVGYTREGRQVLTEITDLFENEKIIWSQLENFTTSNTKLGAITLSSEQFPSLKRLSIRSFNHCIRGPLSETCKFVELVFDSKAGVGPQFAHSAMLGPPRGFRRRGRSGRKGGRRRPRGLLDADPFQPVVLSEPKNELLPYSVGSFCPGVEELRVDQAPPVLFHNEGLTKLSSLRILFLRRCKDLSGSFLLNLASPSRLARLSIDLVLNPSAAALLSSPAFPANLEQFHWFPKKVENMQTDPDSGPPFELDLGRFGRLSDFGFRAPRPTDGGFIRVAFVAPTARCLRRLVLQQCDLDEAGMFEEDWHQALVDVSFQNCRFGTIEVVEGIFRGLEGCRFSLFRCESREESSGTLLL